MTGPSRGLGRSVVEQALGAGHSVVGIARRVDALTEFGQAYPSRFLALPLDVTDSARAQSAVAETVSTFGRVDLVVNNAGFVNIAPIEEVDLDDFDPRLRPCFWHRIRDQGCVAGLPRRAGGTSFRPPRSAGG